MALRDFARDILDRPKEDSYNLVVACGSKLYLDGVKPKEIAGAGKKISSVKTDLNGRIIYSSHDYGIYELGNPDRLASSTSPVYTLEVRKNGDVVFAGHDGNVYKLNESEENGRELISEVDAQIDYLFETDFEQLLAANYRWSLIDVETLDEVGGSTQPLTRIAQASNGDILYSGWGNDVQQVGNGTTPKWKAVFKGDGRINDILCTDDGNVYVAVNSGRIKLIPKYHGSAWTPTQNIVKGVIPTALCQDKDSIVYGTSDGSLGRIGDAFLKDICEGDIVTDILRVKTVYLKKAGVI